MKPDAPAFSVLLLSEDGGNHVTTTLKSLLRHIFRYIDERCQTHRIDFQPPDQDDVRRILVANQWVNRRRSERVALYKYLAERLRDDAAFIVHHIDADRRWRDRRTDLRKPLDRVPAEIVAHVRVILSKFYTHADLDERLRRYLLLVPYWELEAWLYQNTEVALRLCLAHPSCRGSHAALLQEWREDRQRLDDEEHPEERLRPCVGKEHNETLASGGFPAREVAAAGTSFAAAVENFFECPPLLDALARTYASPPS